MASNANQAKHQRHEIGQCLERHEIRAVHRTSQIRQRIERHKLACIWEPSLSAAPKSLWHIYEFFDQPPPCGDSAHNGFSLTTG
jgi:hypothetical protein